MNNYLLTLVLKPNLEDKERKALLDDMVKKLKIENGKLKIDEWGVRDLAYPIKKQTQGYFAHFEFETEPQVAKGLDKSLKVEENLLRYLLVRI